MTGYVTLNIIPPTELLAPTLRRGVFAVKCPDAKKLVAFFGREGYKINL